MVSVKRVNTLSIDKICINKQFLIYVLEFLFIIEPRIFTQYKIPTIIFSGVNLIIFIGLFLQQINKENFKLKNTLYIWIVFCLYSLIAKMQSGDFSFLLTWGYLSLLVCNIIMIFEESIRKKDIDVLLKSIVTVGVIYLGINVLTFVIYDRGIIRSTFFDAEENDWYFLGIKVAYTDYVFAFLSCAFAYYYLTRKKILFILIIILSILNILIPRISTTTLALIIIGILFAVIKLCPKIRFSMSSILIFAIILNIFFVFFNISTLFTKLFGLFGKDATMSSRTIIWTEGKEVLFSEPLKLFFGYGNVNDGAWVPHANGLWHSHNWLLQNLHEVGIVGIILLVYFLSYGTNHNYSKQNIKFYRLKNYLLTICFVITITSVTNSMLGTCYDFIPFLLIKYIDNYSRA